MSEHQCCNDEQVRLLSSILEKMVDLEDRPIGHGLWVHDMVKIKGVPHWWTGAKWQKL